MMTAIDAPNVRALPGFDLAGLLELVGDDRVFLRELIEHFDRDTVRYIAEIRKAACRLDREAFFRFAHVLKGLLSNFGESAALERCRRLEELDTTRDWVEPRVLDEVDALIPEVDTIRRALARIAQ